MTKDEILDGFKKIGVNKKFKPYQEQESPTLLIRTKRPPVITSGFMAGSEIDFYDNQVFRVWTNQIQKARRIAKEKGFRIEILEKECEVYVPIALADEFLPKFGAKVKRTMSLKQAEILKNAGFFKKRAENGHI